MNRTFAIGDIHGCYKTFKKLLLENLNIDPSDIIYLLGDYIDRGPDSKEVIDLILELLSEGFQIHPLRGNHEQMLLDSINNFECSMWLRNGGDSTLRSFSIPSVYALPEKYLTFLKETKLCIQYKDFIYVHAGLNFNNENIFEDKEAMLWIRNIEAFEPVLGNRMLIHGHTPGALNFILNQRGNCINIDGGCVYTHLKGMGNLVAYDPEKRSFVIESNCE